MQSQPTLVISAHMARDMLMWWLAMLMGRYLFIEYNVVQLTDSEFGYVPNDSCLLIIDIRTKLIDISNIYYPR